MSTTRYWFDVQHVDRRTNTVAGADTVLAADRDHAIDRATALHGWAKTNIRAQRARKGSTVLPAVTL